MPKFKLSKQERIKLNKLVKQEKRTKISRRLQFLKLKDKSKTHTEIADIIGVCADTLTDWLNIYSNNGLDGLCQLNYDGRRKTKIDDHIDEIKRDVKKKTISTITELQDLLNDKYHIEIEESWLFRLAKKNFVFPIKRPV